MKAGDGRWSWDYAGVDCIRGSIVVEQRSCPELHGRHLVDPALTRAKELSNYGAWNSETEITALGGRRRLVEGARKAQRGPEHFVSCVAPADPLVRSTRFRGRWISTTAGPGLRPSAMTSSSPCSTSRGRAPMGEGPPAPKAVAPTRAWLTSAGDGARRRCARRLACFAFDDLREHAVTRRETPPCATMNKTSFQGGSATSKAASKQSTSVAHKLI